MIASNVDVADLGRVRERAAPDSPAAELGPRGRSVQQRTTMLWIVASLLAGVHLRDHERSGWFILLATAGVAAFSLGRPLDALYIIATSTVETGRTVYAVAALACYLPLQVWLVLSAARDARGRRQAWALAATAAVIIGMLPVVGIQWVGTLYSLAALVLVSLRRPWSFLLYRDLHDLLGQSLSAVALKGDLAIRLLHNDPPAARAEIESLTGLARDAIRGIHTVSRDEHAVSLRIETEGAAALLSAAGIRCRIDVDLPDLAPPVERVLAWTVREGVTDALRHSEAHTCSITGGRRDGNVILEIVNDDAPATPGEGSGLSGLTERARALSGSVAAGSTADGEFRLLVEVPEGARM